MLSAIHCSMAYNNCSPLVRDSQGPGRHLLGSQALPAIQNICSQPGARVPFTRTSSELEFAVSKSSCCRELHSTCGPGTAGGSADSTARRRPRSESQRLVTVVLRIPMLGRESS